MSVELSEEMPGWSDVELEELARLAGWRVTRTADDECRLDFTRVAEPGVWDARFATRMCPRVDDCRVGDGEADPCHWCRHMSD